MALTIGRLTYADLSTITRRHELVVAVLSDDIPPFNFRSADGSLEGIDIALVKDMARELNVSLRFVRSARTYADLLTQLEKGEADIGASALYPTLSRAIEMRFSDSYFALTPVFVTNRIQSARFGTGDTSVLLKKPGVKVGVYQDSGYASQLHSRFIGLTTLTYKDWEELIRDLQKGVITAAYIDPIEMARWRKQIHNLDLYFRVSQSSEGKAPVAFAIKESDTQLLYWVNLYLKLRQENGFIDKTIQQYSGGLR